MLGGRNAMIRPENESDCQAVRRVHVAAFPTDAEARLVDSLRAAGRLLVSLVVEVDGAVVGHVAFSPVTIGSADARGGVGLGPVAVHPDFQRCGIGKRLVRDGLAACRADGYAFCVVLGEPAYYTRFGFAPAARWKLTNEYGAGPEFMACELREGGVPVAGGLVRYAPEFADL